MPVERDFGRTDPTITRESLIRTARKGGAGLRRIDALKELVRRGGDDIREILAETLSSAEAPSDLRTTAALALGRLPGKTQQDALLRALSDPDPYVVRRAAESLGKIGDRAAAERLAAIPPPELPAARRAIAFARILSSYRLSLGLFRFAAPASSEFLKVEKPVELKPIPARVETLRKVRQHLPEEVPAISVDTRSAVEVECQGDELLVMLTEDAARVREHGIKEKADLIAAVVLKRSSEGRYALFEYIFAHGEEQRILLFGSTPTGALIHTGTATQEREQIHFELRALNTVYSPALELKGSADSVTSPLMLQTLTVNAGLVSNQKRPSAPTLSEIVVPPARESETARDL